MGRKILYGFLGAIFSFIIGAIVLLFIYPSNQNATGPNGVAVLWLLVFTIAGIFLVVKFAGSLNSKYGYKPLSEDKNAPKIQTLYFIAFGLTAALLGPIAMLVLFLLGGEIPLLIVILYLVGTIGYLIQYKKYQSMATNFQSTP